MSELTEKLRQDSHEYGLYCIAREAGTLAGTDFGWDASEVRAWDAAYLIEQYERLLPKLDGRRPDQPDPKTQPPATFDRFHVWMVGRYVKIKRLDRTSGKLMAGWGGILGGYSHHSFPSTPDVTVWGWFFQHDANPEGYSLSEATYQLEIKVF